MDDRQGEAHNDDDWHSCITPSFGLPSITLVLRSRWFSLSHTRNCPILRSWRNTTTLRCIRERRARLHCTRKRAHLLSSTIAHTSSKRESKPSLSGEFLSKDVLDMLNSLLMFGRSLITTLILFQLYFFYDSMDAAEKILNANNYRYGYSQDHPHWAKWTWTTVADRLSNLDHIFASLCFR